MDFMHDQLEDGRKIRVLTVVDQYTRGLADRFFWRDYAIGLNVDDELVEVSALLNTGRLHRIGHATHR